MPRPSNLVPSVPAGRALVGVRLPAQPTGFVFLREGKRGPVWYAKYRLPDGRQVKKRIGPAWTTRGRAPEGRLTRREAEAWLDGVLGRARRGTLPGMVRTKVTFADACEEYLRWLEHDRQRKPSTLRDYRGIIRTHLTPFFGEVAIEKITPEHVEAWAAQLDARRPLNNRTKIKVMTVLFGVMQRARKKHKLPLNPVRPIQRRPADMDVFTPEEVMALVRAAEPEQDAAIFLKRALHEAGGSARQRPPRRRGTPASAKTPMRRGHSPVLRR